MADNDFYLDFNVTGTERKRLVQAISTFTETDAAYLGAPDFAYRVGRFHIDRNGIVSFDAQTDRGEIESLVEALAEQGFSAQISNRSNEDEEAPASVPQEDGTLVVQMPIGSFTEDALKNLHALVAAKGRLIRKALGVELLPIQTDADTVSFPWFNGEVTAEEAVAYTHLISALCDMARNQKRITAKDKEIDNDKYAFRCFLLRLGFIGTEYKAERKILLKNLSGSPAFKSGSRKTS